MANLAAKKKREEITDERILYRAKRQIVTEIPFRNGKV